MQIKCNKGSTDKLPKSMVPRKISIACSCSPEELKASIDWQKLDSVANQMQQEQVDNNQKPFKSFLIDTVRVKINVVHPPLEELTKGNPNVKRNGYKFIVTDPKTGAVAQVVSRKQGAELFIEASVPKFLTGQNIAGHLDVHEGCVECIKKTLKLLGINPSTNELRAISSGQYELTRVDVTVHVDCGTAELVQALMLALRGHLVNHGKDVSMYGIDTLYLGQHSKRRTLKIYNKGLELEKKNRQIPDHVYGSAYLTRKAKSLVRLELTLRGKELTRLDLTSPLDWNESVAEALITPWVDELKSTNICIPNVNGSEQLSSVMQAKLCSWLLGDALAFSRNVTHDTYRNGRQKVLKATGIDVDNGLSPELQATCLTTTRKLFENGFGFRSYQDKWDELIGAINRYKPPPASTVTTSQPN